MHKILLLLVLSLGVMAGGYFIFLGQLGDDSEETIKEAVPEDFSQAEKEVGVIDDERLIPRRMLEMSIQKVSIGGPEYQDIPKGVAIEGVHHIQMNDENILYLLHSFDSLSTDVNSPCRAVLTKWLNHNVSDVDKDVQRILATISDRKDVIEVVKKTEAEEEAYKKKYFQ
ncbi:hypothetical protein [Bacillus massiliglaciei]|uniref:hypothetical protein n=1 Tax=Bacillus massiliglaciei TaxID=1816693 RepID=UPI000DA63AED|nr:hypothetical protein [Bacillus massiliglaciei]